VHSLFLMSWYVTSALHCLDRSNVDITRTERLQKPICELESFDRADTGLSGY